MESTLTIDRVGDEDYGLYQCVGYNEKSLDPVQFTVAKPSTCNTNLVFSNLTY